MKWFTKKKLESLKEKDFFIKPYYLAVREYLKGKKYPLDILKYSMIR
jgi:hypothetical protein